MSDTPKRKRGREREIFIRFVIYCMALSGGAVF